MKKSLRSLSDCLNTGPTLQTLISRSRKQQLLLQQVQSLLPEPLSGHCVSVVKNASRLLLYADSSAWAGRIRFITSELGVKLRECGHKVDRISVRVLLNNPPPSI